MTYEVDSASMSPVRDMEQDCGLDDDGQCALAGSEHCDFECPFRDSEYFAGSAAWCRKHGEEKEPA